MTLASYIREHDVPWNFIAEPLLEYAGDLYEEALERAGNLNRARYLRYLADRVVLV